MGKDDFRVLTAVELGMRNHHAVPVPLISSIASIRGNVSRFLSTLLRFKLVYHDNTRYDGYRLTWTGYDVLALHALSRRKSVDRLGSKIGEGKESDVYDAYRESDGARVVIKFHRLGKTSFKAVKSKRDYLDGRASAGNWLNMSRLAAKREWDFLNAIQRVVSVRTPTPIDYNRHAVVMTFAPGFPLYQLSRHDNSAQLFRDCLAMAQALASRGLIHCDLNEFNIIVDGHDAYLIDFPQMVSTSHPNAADYFKRDVRGLIKFFRSKLKCDVDDEDERGEAYDDLRATLRARPLVDSLDLAVKASGYDRSANHFDKSLDSGEEGSEEDEGDEEEGDEEDYEDTEDGEEVQDLVDTSATLAIDVQDRTR